MTTLRFTARVALLLVVLLVCLPMFLITRGRAKDWWLRRFLIVAASACGIRLHVEGEPIARNVLLAANHISWLDIITLGGVSGCAFVSKREVGDWPLVGWLARISGTIFISRESRGETHKQAATIADAVRRGRPIALFPEGTTGDGYALLPFRASLFAAVAGTDIVVQPVAIDYGGMAPAMKWPRGEAAHRNMAKLLRRRGIVDVTLRFQPPIDCRQLDRKEIARRAFTAVESGLGDSYGRQP